MLTQMNWQTILVAGILFTAALISLFLLWWVSRKRDIPAVFPFLLLLGALGEWSLTYALEILFPGLAWKMFWAQCEYIGIALAPVSFWFFARIYTGGGDSFDRRKAFAFLIIPILTVLIAFTNRYHGLLWSEYRLNDAGPLAVFSVQRYGLWWWIFFIYSYALLAWGCILVLGSIFNRPLAFRRQSYLILASLALPWLGNALYLGKINPVSQLDFSPIAFILSAILLAWAIFYFRLFDLVPINGLDFIYRLDAAAFVLDRQERIIELNNAARAFGSRRDGDAVGYGVGEVFPWWENLDGEVRSAQVANADIPLEIDGLRRYCALQISPIYGDSHSQLFARLVVLRDVTGEHLASESIALAQVKTEFLAKVGHELRSPLTSILGLAEMLDYGVYGALSEEQRKAVRMISESTQNMTRMVNDLLQQSRLERGTFKLDITEFPLSELLTRVTEHAAPLVKVKGLRLRTEISPEAPERICSDSLRLYQIVVNLVDNAIKYTLEGEITLRVFASDPASLSFQVQDTGVGIPPDVQQLIFNPFQQVSPNQVQRENGFGLGLSIVKQLVSLMDGRIKFESEVGKGSIFTVSLPLELPRRTEG